MGLAIRILIIFAIIFFFTKVKLNPEINRAYFFSATDQTFKEYQQVASIFPPGESLVLVVKSRTYSPYSLPYYQQINQLTKKIAALKGVKSIYSLSRGPKSITEARENLIWRVIIFGESKSSTIITSNLDTKFNPKIISEIETVVKENTQKSFDIKVSGTPYLVEMIKRYIYHDLKILALTILLVSALVLLLLYRSLPVLIGSFLTTIPSVLLSLLVMQYFKIPFGILSPNLLIVIFLLCQSHIIFLTSNYLHIANQKEALKKTFIASLASAMVIFFGFWTLSEVEAKPLQELGQAGMIGTFVALVSAYVIYPKTLDFLRPKITDKENSLIYNFLALITRFKYLASVIVVILCIFLSLSTSIKLNTNTSIINYFAKNSEARAGALALDKQGGSSTLRLIVSRWGATLDTEEAYNAMSALHYELANHKDVGAVVSLPLLMQESKREKWITRFLSWNKMIDILSSDRYQNIARRFMTRDRKHALFILRMKETKTNKTKSEIIKNIEGIVRKHGLVLDHKGGPYPLQARLASLVKTSLYDSLIYLLLAFILVSALVSANWMISFIMSLNLILIMQAILGTFALMGASFDIISAPTILIALFLAIDIMIHLAISKRQNNLAEQFIPVTAIMITNLGFISLYFSDFMPMQYFCFTIVIAMIITAALSSLYGRIK